MADEVVDWAKAFLSIPLPTVDYLGSFSYDENDDINFESIFAEIDDTAPSPNPEPADPKDYKAVEDYGDQEQSSFSPKNPNPNPKSCMDVNEPVRRSRPAVISHSSSSGTSLINPEVIAHTKFSFTTNSYSSLQEITEKMGNNEGWAGDNYDVNYDDNDDIDFEAIFAEIDGAIPNPNPKPADLIDYKGFEDYSDKEWSSFFPKDPNPKSCTDVKEPVPRSRPVVSRSKGSGTSFNPVVLDDDDDREIEIRRQDCKRKRVSHWSLEEEYMGLLQESYQGYWPEHDDKGLLLDDYDQGNWNSTQMQLYEPMKKVARVN